MDLAYLNAIIKSSYFPPYDPWFAGGYINYYYYGLVNVATLTKATGIVPEVAYNLAIPTLFALTAMGACSVTFNLVRPRASDAADEGGWWPRALRYGVVGALLVAVAGNLGEVRLLWGGFEALGGDVALNTTIPGLAALVRVFKGVGAFLKGAKLPFRPEWWYWNASRVMGAGEINEFPFFTFLYADLHAHLTALPFTTLVLGLATGLVARPVAHLTRLARDLRAPDAAQGEGWRARLVRWWQARNWALVAHVALLGLAVGELWCNNSWDLPTYLLVAVGALGCHVYARWSEANGRTSWQTALTRWLLLSLAVTALSVAFFRPFHAHFGSAYTSVERWKSIQTKGGDFVVIHGLPLFVLSSYLLALTFGAGARGAVARAIRAHVGRLMRWPRTRRLYAGLVRRQSLSYGLAWFGLALLAVLLLVLILRKQSVAVLTLPLLPLAVPLALDRRVDAADRFVRLLIALGLALAVGVEYVVIKGDIGRMNTVFKFYLQIWVLWGISAAVALAHLLPRCVRWPLGWRRAWQMALALLLIGVALYPVCALVGKVNDRWSASQPNGLDGMEYMQTAHYSDGADLTLEYDRRAIMWLRENVQGSPVIAEANTPLYRWGNRISIYTGLPTIVGWDWHQKQQRAAVSGWVVDWNLQDVRDLYASTDLVLKRQIIARHKVAYIYVGELEQAYYGGEGLGALAEMVGSDLEIVYQDGPVTIYRVVGAQGLARAPAEEAPPFAEAQAGDGVLADLREWLSRHWVGRAVRADGPAKEPSSNRADAPATPDLMLDGPVDQLPVLRDRGWNRWIADSAVGQALCWWLVLQLIGLAAWPVARRIAPHQPDAGYGLAKGLGLLLVSYLVWIGASLRLTHNTPTVAWGALALLAVVGLVLTRRPRQGAGPVRRRLIVLEEVLFSAAFFAFVSVRLLNPDLWQPWFGGEKMMEIAILNALTKSAYMPPYDPYFAGGYLNYYYYGQFIANVLVKLTGVTPEVGFNLAVPTFFALTVAHVFAVGRQLATRSETGRSVGRQGVLGGLAAVLVVALLGNLSGLIQGIELLARAGGATFAGDAITLDELGRVLPGLMNVLRGQASLGAFDYWYRGTRIIPYTINEFPFFSFLFADLHPHMIGIPFTVLAVGLLLALLCDRRDGVLADALRWAALTVTVGALGVINTWDLPTALGLLGVAMLYRGFRRGRWRGMLGALVGLPIAALCALLLYAPFYSHYRAQGLGVALVPADTRSPLINFAVIWGALLFLALSLLGAWLRDGLCSERIQRLMARLGRRRAWRRLWALRGAGVCVRVWGVAALALGVVSAMALALLGESLLALLTAAVLVAAAAWLANPPKRAAAFLQRLLLSTGLALLLGVEIVFVRDFLAGGDWQRMNTVFKFYTQAWMLLGLAAGAALPELWARANAARGWGVVWQACGMLLIGGSLLYTAIAVPVRVNERMPSAWPARNTLDGTAYMTTGVYHWPDADSAIDLQYDRAAIAWLWENVEGTPVLAEAAIGYYREGGLRVSSYTGLPTLVGMHQSEQRPYGQVAMRQSDADGLYETTNVQRLFELIERHRVSYIYVGQLERRVYGADGLAKFEMLAAEGALERAYANDRVVIYRVPSNQGAWRMSGGGTGPAQGG
jgi:YYY domain-containing protein